MALPSAVVSFISEFQIERDDFLKLVFLFFALSFNEMTGAMDAGYPRSIEEDFPGIDDEIDAAAYHYGTAASTSVMFIHQFK